MSSPDVVLDAVSKRYGTVTAVDNVSLEIEPGSYCCLLGPSGCGKTSTLRMIAGHEQISAGRVLIRGQDVTGLPPSRRNTALMFQDYALFPHLTLVDNVAFGLKMRGVGKTQRRKQAAEMLDLVGMAGYEQQLPAQLSGGQRQRTALARALITEPAVLLLDEPLSALDRLLRVRMRSELKRLQRQFGVTFVHVTHAQDEALALADLVVVMQDGRIAQQGSPREVYGQAHTPFVASFIGDHSVLHGLVISSDGATLELAGPEGQRYAVPGAARLGAEVCFTVRADHARLTTGPSAGPNVLSGVAAAVEYLGHIVRVRLETSSGLELLVYQPEAEFAAAPVDLGQVTQACWSTEDAVLLADPAAPESRSP